jgi:hypothetical protein
MRRAVVFTVALVAIAGLGMLAADVFQTYQLNRQGWDDSFVSAVAANWFNPYQVPKALKALPPAERVAVVNALGAAYKAFFETPAFKEAYRKRYEASLPDDLKPPRTAKQIADEMRAEQAKAAKDMEESMKNVPPEMRKQMEATAAQIRAAMKEQEAAIDEVAGQLAQQEKARYEAAKNRPPDPDATPADPRVALKRALKNFLAATAGVDYSAALRTAADGKVFVNPAYEQKHKEWKMCYRAGKDTCEAARAFAANWLAELK